MCKCVFICLINTVINLKSAEAFHCAKSGCWRFMVNSVTLFLKHSHCYLLMLPLCKNAQHRRFHLENKTDSKPQSHADIKELDYLLSSGREEAK